MAGKKEKSAKPAGSPKPAAATTATATGNYADALKKGKKAKKPRAPRAVVAPSTIAGGGGGVSGSADDAAGKRKAAAKARVKMAEEASGGGGGDDTRRAVGKKRKGRMHVEVEAGEGIRSVNATTSSSMALETQGSSKVAKPQFAELSASEQAKQMDTSVRRITVPKHRMTPLRNSWMEIYRPIVENMHLQIRMNVKSRKIEVKTSDATTEVNALQKAADFIKAFFMGFEAEDAVALLRLDDLYIDTFEVDDVKMLKGDHLARAIGRIAGKDGTTKNTIENTTRTRIVLADKKVHILGTYHNIRMAKNAVMALILGSPPGKVYGKLRTVASRSRSMF